MSCRTRADTERKSGLTTRPRQKTTMMRTSSEAPRPRLQQVGARKGAPAPGGAVTRGAPDLACSKHHVLSRKQPAFPMDRSIIGSESSIASRVWSKWGSKGDGRCVMGIFGIGMRSRVLPVAGALCRMHNAAGLNRASADVRVALTQSRWPRVSHARYRTTHTHTTRNDSTHHPILDTRLLRVRRY